MASSSHYDIIIVGSGAGGGTLARQLAPSGKRILLLERGPFVPRERQNWDAREVWLRRRYHTSEPWYNGRGKPFDPEVYYYVGGNTKMYGAALFRLRKEDFQELAHHGGMSPAWPISYDELEPYYSQAEQWYQVHGQRGADPTEPPASCDYPFKPLRHEPRIQQLYDEFTRAGYQPFPLPVGVMLQEPSHHSLCIRCNTCDGFPCLLHAKADAEVIGVRPALRHDNVTLETGATVKRLITSPSGREVTEVVVEREGEECRFRADIVVLAAGAANTARILLMSANDRHPQGLANGSDQVGRNFLCHNRTVFIAISKLANTTQFQKTLSLNDFYFGTKEFPYPMGNIQMLGKTQGEMFKSKGARWAPLPLLEKVAHHALDFFLTSEDLPCPENRVTVDAQGRLQLHYRANNQEPMRRLEAQLKRMLREIASQGLLSRSICTAYALGLEGLGHQAGTCRFGHSPDNSVLDANCKAHELDNLYVVDASFFPSIGAVNPSLTIMANALRLGDHLLERLGAKQSIQATR